MAYDRYDRFSDRGKGGNRDERGFLDRAGDEIASWFGDDEAERRREENRRREEYNAGRGRHPMSRNGRDEMSHDPDRFREHGRDYRPMTGDYGRSSNYADSEQFFAASGVPRGGFGGDDRSRYQRSQSPWGRDDYRNTSYAASYASGGRDHDPHYAEWRRRHLEELDRDYDDYRREHQSKFESDFGGWRERRQSKRQMLGQIREHMEVVGNDDDHVGTIDRVAGDRIILTKSDPAAGGAHHSLSCSDIDRIDGDRIILDCSSEQARQRWRDESRSRALFEREDAGEGGPRILDRSFEGTYR